MPLLDHFHAPNFARRPWESFYSLWCAAILDQLNKALPPRYFGAVQVYLGNHVEADVAGFDVAEQADRPAKDTAAFSAWVPPVATHVVAAVFPDDIEVQIYDSRDGAVLVAVVELVSPRNKDRSEAFAAKCAAYLQRGVGLLVVDIVTSRRANLHNILARLLRWPQSLVPPEESALYTAAYHPVRRQEQNQIDNWLVPLAVGQALPTMPLPLRGFGCLPLDLEASYSHARQSSRL